MSQLIELNIDGLVGPTHHFGGLAFGNIASANHARQVSNPQKAALQGLDKMRLLADLGIPQAIMPPHERPYLPLLRNLGFQGTPEQMVRQAMSSSHLNLDVLGSACYSAAAMWVANSATVSPSFQTRDKKVHITPANLAYQFHRSFESQQNKKILKKIFSDPKYFTVHEPLYSHALLGDEGAANHHTVYSQSSNSKFFSKSNTGGEIFVFGSSRTKRFPARATQLAAESISRRHKLLSDRVLYLQQTPESIDAGVFHNDVIAVGNENVYFYHLSGYSQSDQKKLKTFYHEIFKDQDYYLMPVTEYELTLEQVVSSYLFNSQLITLPNDTMHQVLIAPENCRYDSAVQKVMDRVLSEDNPIRSIQYVDLSESLSNGGGPACLRLRALLTQQEFLSINSQLLFTPEKYNFLKNWIIQYYPTELKIDHLSDPQLIQNNYEALDQLTQILNLGSIYGFQGAGM